MPRHTQLPSKKDLERFVPIVKKAARKAGQLNAVVSVDDIEQDMWFNIINHWDHFCETYDDGTRLAKTMCNQVVCYLVHWYERRPDTSMYAAASAQESPEEEGDDFFNSVFEGMGKISHGSIFPTPEESFFGSELFKLIKEFASTKTGKIREFLNEFISPSQETQEWWEQRCKEAAVLRGYTFIPPQSLSTKILGSKGACGAVMKELREFLMKSGYSPAMA